MVEFHGCRDDDDDDDDCDLQYLNSLAHLFLVVHSLPQFMAVVNCKGLAGEAHEEIV